MNAGGSNSSRFLNLTPFVSKNQTYNTSVIDLASPARSKVPTVIEDAGESTCNFIITNVTSVPAEFFASVPESPTKETLLLPTPSTPAVTNLLKRNHQEACSEEVVVTETPKRARFDSTIDLEPAKVDDELAPLQNIPSLPETPSKAVVLSTPPPLVGPSCASTVSENVSTTFLYFLSSDNSVIRFIS